MTAPVNRLSQRELTHGPRTARSLQSKRRNTVALGSSTPARAWTALVKSSEGCTRRKNEDCGQEDQAEVDTVKCLGVLHLPMQRMPQRQHIADGVGGCERHRRGADDASIDEREREQDRRQLPRISLQPGRDGARVGKVSGPGLAGENRGGEPHHRDTPDHDKGDADPEVEPLVSDKSRGDALVDDVALLEEQLPWRHRGSDDGDDEQHHLAQLTALGHLRHEEVMSQQRNGRVYHQDDRDKQQAAEYEEHRKPLETAEVAVLTASMTRAAAPSTPKFLGSPR